MQLKALWRLALGIMLAPPRQLSFWVQAASMALLWRWASVDVCDGVPVGVLSSDKAQVLRPRVCEALALIRELDPRRYRSVRGRLKGILVAHAQFNSYSRGYQTCILAEDLLDTSAAVTASSIIHETTHARLGSVRALIPGKRIEATCIREQVAFAKLLPPDRYPNAEEYVRYLESWIGVWPMHLRFGGRYRRKIAQQASARPPN